MTSAIRRVRLAAALATSLCACAALADTTPQTLPFSQDWTADAITANDDWSGVPGIQGFLGSDLTASTGADPQTLVAADSPGTVDVVANITAPNSSSSGGVGEIAITDRVVALQGSGTADAPYIKLYLDTTGESDITVSYTLRDVDGSTDNAVQPVALQYRVGDSGDFTNVAAAYVADATTGPSLATLETLVEATLPAAAENQPLVELRIITANAVGNDEWVGIDDILVAGSGVPPVLALSVADVAQAEGDAGAEADAWVTVSLNGAAPAGGVTFDLASAAGTATDGIDYLGPSANDHLIPEGETSVQLGVRVYGDDAVEDDETVLITVSDVVGADLADGEAVVTIVDDDIADVAIHDIQGDTGTSPYDGEPVETGGIVTAIRWNGFQLQTPDAQADADPATSEGVFVYTGNTSPLLTTLLVGDAITLTATVDEYTPSARPHQRSLTELVDPIGVAVLSSGNALPTPVPLTAGATSVDEFERYEGMRVSLGALTAISPAEGRIDEPNAVGTAYGTFYGTLGDTPRPFREEGLSVLDATPLPGGVTPPVFDNNPERIRIVNDQEGATPIVVDVGAVVTGITGVLDYDYAIYSVLPDPGAAAVVTGGVDATEVTDPAFGEITVAGFNLLHFYDTVNDAGGDSVLTEAAFAIRLEKAARAICDSLKTPDIIGVVEVENLSTLQALASAINDDTFGVCERDPQYSAYLEPGNDGSNINVGFLVSTAEIVAAVPRVEVVSVTQVDKTATFENPNLSTSTLFDRPPLILEAVVNNLDGSEYPLTVIANHLLSLTSVSSLSSGSNGWTTAGERARAKRGYQAVRTAGIVEELQLADPDAHIVLLGDFNAFEFNDGYVDVMGIVSGREAAADEVIAWFDSPLTVPLTNMTTVTEATHRYSYSFDGNAQVLDHILVNQALLDDVPGVRTEHPRINADFGVDHFGDAATPLRVSDHDPVLLYIPLDVEKLADASVAVTAGADTADAAATLAFTVDVANAGPVDAEDVLVTLVSSVATSSFTASGTGFACTAVDATTVECAAASLAPGGGASLAVELVAADYLPGSATLTATVTTSTTDPDATDDSGSDTTALTVLPTDLALARNPPVSYLVLGSEAVAAFEVRNASANAAYSPRLNLRITAGDSAIAPDAPAGWTCGQMMSTGSSDPRVRSWSCAHDGPYAAGRADVLTFTITPPKSMPVTVEASTFTQNPDTNPANNRANAAFSVILTP